jgi:hypothetical protein
MSGTTPIPPTNRRKETAMLDVLRRNAGSWAIKIVLSFIALTFIWWGVGTYSERDRNVAAKVAGETITTGEVAETAAGLEKTYREVYGPAFTPEMAKALDLRKQALDAPRPLPSRRTASSARTGTGRSSPTTASRRGSSRRPSGRRSP